MASPFLGLFAFLIAYGIYMLFIYRIDPRYSLVYEKPPSFNRLLWLAPFEKLVLLLILVVLALIPQSNLVTVFSFNTIAFTPYALAIGIVGGVLIFAGGLPVNAVISAARRRLSLQQTKRESELTQLLTASMSKPRSYFFLNVFTTSVFAGILEETIFRGYLLGHLQLVTLPIIGIVLQAIFSFAPQLYQGIYNGLLSLYGGILFGIIFFLSGSLLAAIIAHVTQDIVGFIFTFATPKRQTR
ncbi:MAG TPA: CPBP family intramembrane glutamic endopeptidase [Candidatus Bathyarchaeia archaeon]|nr:CPBP family intramembrane glutamic endopeptidase [Candidatus Bathyarchaeia archaeon]